MSHEHTILITAGGGNIGSELVPQLLQHPVRLVLPTSNAGRLQSALPPSATAHNVAVEEGSITDPNWVESLLTKHNVDAVFLCLTGIDELIVTLNVLDAMRKAGCLKHVVYLSACGDYVSAAGVRTVMQFCSAEHVVVKTTIEQKLAYAGFPWTTTVLGPTLFFSNDLRSKDSMLSHGFFFEPLGSKGVSRVSTFDIALAASKTLLAPEKYAGRKIMLGSLRRYTNADVRHIWSEAIGREIHMCGSDAKDLAAFEERLTTALTALGRPAPTVKPWARDLRLMFELFDVLEFGMSEEEYRAQVELLGKEPEDYEAWVQKTGASWRS